MLVWMPREDARAWKGGNVAVTPYFLLVLYLFLAGTYCHSATHIVVI
jgi:hypothetical protein